MNTDKAFILFAFFALMACSKKKDNTQACTQEAKAALTVTVADSKTGQYLGDSVSVQAITKSTTITLDLFSANPPVFSGAYELADTYTITASHPRYQTYKTGAVTVSKDECHVIPQTLSIKLLAK